MKTKNCRCCQGSGRELDSVAYGAEMLALRLSKGVKQYALAMQMGFSAAYISDLEKGKRNWSDRITNIYKESLESCAKQS